MATFPKQNKQGALFLASIFAVAVISGGIWYWQSKDNEIRPDTLPATAVGGATIDILVLYNKAASTLYNGSIDTRINHLVDVSNQIYKDSGVNLNLRLVHTLEVDYEANYDSETAINHVTKQSHPAFTDVPDIRKEYGADLVVLMRPYADDGYCGIAWIGGNGTNGDFSNINEKDYGYSHVSIDCSTYVLSHELGHNMGLNHSRKQNNSGGTFDYALGYGVDNDFATIMAYSSEFNANKINLFSNPNISCGSTNCGINRDASNSADASYALNLVTPQIADYFAQSVQGFDSWLTGNLDADGNGTSDIILQHVDGEWSLNTMNGTEVTAVLPLPLINDPAWHTAVQDDYNGDGISDILLRNIDTGEWRIFLMNGDTVIEEKKLTMTGNLNWQVAGSGDFDGDGLGDILLRNTDGRWYIYFLDGTKIKATGRPDFPEDLDYRVSTAGDFDGDGKTDIMLRASDGSWELFNMNGAEIASRSSLPIKKSLDWKAMASGDFNGDEKDDLLLRYKNGAWLVYQFEDGKVNTTGFLSITNELDWKMASVGDFNGDGNADILLRSDSFGTWKLYTMSQNQIKTTGSVALTEDLGWLIPRS